MKKINEQEKWSVKLTKDNIRIINEFFHKNSSHYKNYKPDWRFTFSDIESDYYFHFPETKSGCYASPDGYNVISNEEFLLKVNNDKTYPTSLNTVKFFGIMGATQKSVDAFEKLKSKIDNQCMKIYADRNSIDYKWDIMNFPLTPKDCYTTLPNIIYVKKLKTFLKNG